MDFFSVLLFEKLGYCVPFGGKNWEALFAASVSAYPVTTITGALPLTFSSKGGNLTDYLISGNTVQNGTPTPSNPVDVVGCGERTGNLCPMMFSHTGIGDDAGNIVTMDTRLWGAKIEVSPSQDYCIEIDGEASNGEALCFNRIIQYDANGDFISRISVVNQT